MKMLFRPRCAVALIAATALSSPLLAATAPKPPAISEFAPQSDTTDQRLDYSYWDEALAWFVVPMGPSIREGAPRVVPNAGTRRIYGHESRFRLEGNRVAFSFLTDDIRTGLTEYRKDLERIGSEMDITSWPRNEQLAFWLNIHNVAVLEALAYEYPLGETADRTFGSNEAPLHDAKLITIKGISLSPRDIRERIVYPNWKDPKVMYGFWRGEIGGPSIQRAAFNANNVNQLLSFGAEEYVNSLRGVEKYSGALQLSKIYEEAQPFYFSNESDLRAHLNQFARDEVKKLIAKTSDTRFKSYETDVADLTRGERDPALTQFGYLIDPVGGERNFRSYQTSNGTFVNSNSRISPSIQRLVAERNQKLRKAFKRGIRTGTVTFSDGEAAGESGKEVE